MELKRAACAACILAMAGAAAGQQGTRPGTPAGQPPGTREPGYQSPGRDTQPPGRAVQPGRDAQQPGRDMQQPGRTAAQQPLTQAEVDRITANWPQASRQAVRDLTAKYGQPDAATPMMVLWRNNGPWKYSIVYGAEVRHDFPMPHTDVLEQFIDYKVPPDKFDDLAQFDGSVVAARTAGLLAAWCDKEAMNFLALNLAHEIITGKKSVEEARQFYAQEAMNFKQGRPSTYTQGLMFEPMRNAGDPDTPVQPGQTGTPRTPGTPGMERPITPQPGETPGRPGTTPPGTPPRPGERPGSTDPSAPPRPGNQPPR